MPWDMMVVEMAFIFSLRGLRRPVISPVALLMATFVALATAEARVKPLAPLPAGAKEVTVLRYRSPLSYRATLQWYEKNAGAGGKRLTFETLVDLPDVVAAHAESIRADTPWSGLNISEFEGNVWIFIIAR